MTEVTNEELQAFASLTTGDEPNENASFKFGRFSCDTKTRLGQSDAYLMRSYIF